MTTVLLQPMAVKEMERKQVFDEVKGQGRIHLTKYGGYRDIPNEIISQQAERIGLEEIPIVVISPYAKHGETKWADTIKKPIVIIPRRESKKTVPWTLRHEFAHIKLGHPSPESRRTMALDTKIRHELEVGKLMSGGSLSVDDICNVAGTYVLEEGYPKGQVLSIVSREATDLGATKNVITRGKKWLKDFWEGYET